MTKHFWVRDVKGGSEVWDDQEVKRYYGFPSGPFRVLVEIFVAPFRYGMVFSSAIVGVVLRIFRIAVFADERAILVEDTGEAADE